MTVLYHENKYYALTADSTLVEVQYADFVGEIVCYNFKNGFVDYSGNIFDIKIADTLIKIRKSKSLPALCKKYLKKKLPTDPKGILSVIHEIGQKQKRSLPLKDVYLMVSKIKSFSSIDWYTFGDNVDHNKYFSFDHIEYVSTPAVSDVLKTTEFLSKDENIRYLKLCFGFTKISNGPGLYINASPELKEYLEARDYNLKALKSRYRHTDSHNFEIDVFGLPAGRSNWIQVNENNPGVYCFSGPDIIHGLNLKIEGNLFRHLFLTINKIEPTKDQLKTTEKIVWMMIKGYGHFDIEIHLGLEPGKLEKFVYGINEITGIYSACSHYEKLAAREGMYKLSSGILRTDISEKLKETYKEAMPYVLDSTYIKDYEWRDAKERGIIGEYLVWQYLAAQRALYFYIKSVRSDLMYGFVQNRKDVVFLNDKYAIVSNFQKFSYCYSCNQYVNFDEQQQHGCGTGNIISFDEFQNTIT